MPHILWQIRANHSLLTRWHDVLAPRRVTRTWTIRCSVGSAAAAAHMWGWDNLFPMTLCIRNDGGGCWTGRAMNVFDDIRWSSQAARSFHHDSTLIHQNLTRSHWYTAAAWFRGQPRRRTDCDCGRCTQRSWWTLSHSDTEWVWWTVAARLSQVRGVHPSATTSRLSVFGPNLQATRQPLYTHFQEQPVNFLHSLHHY